jgi:hypothetical protein
MPLNLGTGLRTTRGRQLVSAARVLKSELVGPAMADTHLSKGGVEHGRNDAGFGEGPHCHDKNVATEQFPTRLRLRVPVGPGPCL